MTGETNVLRADVVYDAAKSLNPVIDLGQIQGCFVMGLGFVLREGFEWETDGSAHTEDHWHYKAPVAADIPSKFNVSYFKGSTNQKSIMGSKTAGEPPINMCPSIMAAIKMAIVAARAEAGLAKEWVQVDCPMTPAKISMACGQAAALAGMNAASPLSKDKRVKWTAKSLLSPVSQAKKITTLPDVSK